MTMASASSDVCKELDSPFPISEEQIERFRKYGYVKIPGVLSPEVISAFREPVSRVVHANNKYADVPLEERDTYGKAFIQVTNVWEKNEQARPFVLNRRLGQIATELLGVDGVRLYHDQALYKEPSGGITPWHMDQFYWPLSSDRTVTAWIPLVEVPIEMGPLSFAAGSQDLDFGRELGISDNSEQALRDAIENAACPFEASAYALGEVSFHLGWTAHRAGPNRGDKPREVMTMIYMDKDIRLIEPQHENHIADRDAFCPGVEVGQVVDSPKNPIVFER